jgi:hypothetical protein
MARKLRLPYSFGNQVWGIIFWLFEFRVSSVYRCRVGRIENDVIDHVVVGRTKVGDRASTTNEGFEQEARRPTRGTPPEWIYLDAAAPW